MEFEWFIDNLPSGFATRARTTPEAEEGRLPMARYSCDDEGETLADDEARPTLAHDPHGERTIGLIPKGGPVWGPSYIYNRIMLAIGACFLGGGVWEALSFLLLFPRLKPSMDCASQHKPTIAHTMARHLPR